MQVLEQIVETQSDFYRKVYTNLRDLSLDTKPFDVTPDIVDCVWSVAGSKSEGYERATALYKWFVNNVRKFDVNSSRYRNPVYMSASETFNSGIGLCVDFGFLYTTMARVAGINASFVLVDEDYRGNTEAHACSGVYVGNSNRIILVDHAKGGFDVKHRRFRILSDGEARFYYNNFCLNWNSGRESGFSNNADVVEGNNFGSQNCNPIFNSDNPVLRYFRRVAFAAALSFAGYVVNNVECNNLLNRRSYVEVSNKGSSGSVIVTKDDRRIRFDSIAASLRRIYPNNTRFRNVSFPDDYIFVTRSYIDYLMSKK